MLVPGWKYEVTLYYASTKLAEGPDYDYMLMQVGDMPPNVAIEDADGLFGADETSMAFADAGKSALISLGLPPSQDDDGVDGHGIHATGTIQGGL